MTIRKFEQRLREVDPRFTIKTYGNGIAGIHRFGPGGRPDGRYILRVPVGEISVYSVIEEVAMDIHGRYQLVRKMTRRGRQDVADMLHRGHFINYEQRNFLIRGE